MSELALVPSDGGKFEVEADGDLIYSKIATGSFPSEAEIVTSIRARL